MGYWKRRRLQKAKRYDKPTLKVSPHFTAGELNCKDGTGYIEGLIRYENLRFWQAYRRRKTLVKYLERVRKKVGKPIKLTSVYRHPAYNANVGGETNSAHTRGYAADMDVPSGISVGSFAALVRSVFPSGVGVYPTQGFVHGDFDSRLGRRDWVG